MYVKITRKQIVEGVISLELSDQAKTAPWDNFLVCQILCLFTLLRVNALTNFNTRVAYHTLFIGPYRIYPRFQFPNGTKTEPFCIPNVNFSIWCGAINSARSTGFYRFLMHLLYAFPGQYS